MSTLELEHLIAQRHGLHELRSLLPELTRECLFAQRYIIKAFEKSGMVGAGGVSGSRGGVSGQSTTVASAVLHEHSSLVGDFFIERDSLIAPIRELLSGELQLTNVLRERWQSSDSATQVVNKASASHLLSRAELKELDRTAVNYVCKKEIPRKLKQLLNLIKLERKRVNVNNGTAQVSNELHDVQAMKCHVVDNKCENQLGECKNRRDDKADGVQMIHFEPQASHIGNIDIYNQTHNNQNEVNDDETTPQQEYIDGEALEWHSLNRQFKDIRNILGKIDATHIHLRKVKAPSYVIKFECELADLQTKLSGSMWTALDGWVSRHRIAQTGLWTRYGDDVSLVHKGTKTRISHIKNTLSFTDILEAIDRVIGVAIKPGSRRTRQASSRANLNENIDEETARNENMYSTQSGGANFGSFASFHSRYQTRESSTVVVARDKHALALKGSRMTRDWVL